MRILMALAMLAVAPWAFSGAQTDGFDPGLKVGSSLPPFRLVDQEGKFQDFQSLKGPKGLVLMFFRSADW